MQKTTVILGASTNPARYSYRAVKLLKKHDIPVIPVGIKKGEIAGEKIISELPQSGNIHTLTLYLNKKRQEKYYDQVAKMKPKRVIFNPGTENNEWTKKLADAGTEVVEHCTLIMLNEGMF